MTATATIVRPHPPGTVCPRCGGHGRRVSSTKKVRDGGARKMHLRVCVQCARAAGFAWTESWSTGSGPEVRKDWEVEP